MIREHCDICDTVIMRVRSFRRRYDRFILLVVLAALTNRALPEQEPKPNSSEPTLKEILHRLQDNLNRYRALVPSFYCNEHIVSDVNASGTRQWESTDATFRVARNASGTLIESREVNAIDGTSINGKKLKNSPVILSHVFNGGLVAVSEDQTSCMQYTLEPGHSNKTYVISFATLPEARNRVQCVLKDDGSGRVFVDEDTLHVTKMELEAPHHMINTGEVGVWKISIDYSALELGGQTFWMPGVLSSTFVVNDPNSPIVYSYLAHYFEYHKLDVSSRIVPNQ